MLGLCNRFWGRRTIISATPAVEEHWGVLYMPFTSNIYFDRDPSWGVYDHQGDLIEAAALFRGPEKKLIGQDWRSNAHAVEEAPDDVYIYGGPIIPHFGHFLTASLARLWYFRERPDDETKILVHYGDLTNLSQHTYMVDMFDSLGITKRLVAFRQPTRIRKLIVPRPAFEEQAFAHRVFADLCHDIGSRLIVHAAPMNDKPAYVTKTKLTRGVGRIRNEGEIVDVMQSAGVDIISPEQLSISDQITLFARRKIVLGTSTSAFHVNVFVTSPSHAFILFPTSVVNTNFLLIDSVNRVRGSYLYPTQYTEQISGEEGFLTQFIVPHPREIAKEMLRMAAL
jgi:capsular polysaccharide biosynthesis protein